MSLNSVIAGFAPQEISNSQNFLPGKFMVYFHHYTYQGKITENFIVQSEKSLKEIAEILFEAWRKDFEKQQFSWADLEKPYIYVNSTDWGESHSVALLDDGDEVIEVFVTTKFPSIISV